MNMKTIVNICLNGPYSDGFSYQDNLLPKYHRRLGFRVFVIAPTWKWGTNGLLEHVSPSQYVDENGVEIIRIENDQKKPVLHRFKTYSQLIPTLDRVKPDIIFLHGCQMVDSSSVASYVKQHVDIRLYVDNHADDFNSAQSYLSTHILHNLLWKSKAKQLDKVASQFWGVTENAIEFLHKHYDISEERIGILPLGADDDLISSPERDQIRDQTRRLYGICPDDLLLVTGGKLDRGKNIEPLISVVEKSQNRLKLLCFGSIQEDLLPFFSEIDASRVIYAGWQDATGVRNILFAADFAVFPGSQSSLWTQTVATGVPGAFRYWKGGNPVDLGGNCILMKEGNEKEIHGIVDLILSDSSVLDNMRKVALKAGPEKLSYSKIARKSIGLE